MIPLLIWGVATTRQARSKANLDRLVRYAGSIGFALFEFGQNHGTFPNDTTAAALKASGTTTLSLAGNSSNDLFSQLFADSILWTETIFHADVKSARKPDNDFTTDATALADGECVFAYISGVPPNSRKPVAFGPVIPGTKTLDHTHCGHVVILHADTSVTTHQVHRPGAIPYNGMDLLAPSHPVWEGRPPDIKWPK